ncbi:MAG: hypothetical protein PW999_09805 [Paraburkholderia tropica]|nr:hypothetical protein [Paraburkholderia tropica]
MSERKAIREEDGVHKQWFEIAKHQTLESLPEFMRHLSEDFGHDYGTICHAIAAAAVGAAWALEKTPKGGITGFQAGAVMWSFIQNWMSMDGPLRLVDYNNLLYPQYADKFNTISQDTWDAIQAKARKNLEERSGASDAVVSHWQFIADGHVPFGLRVAA